MKKLLLPLLAALLAFSHSFAAETPALPAFPWERDAQQHWQGSPSNARPHSLDDIWICTVCGCEVLDWGDGSADVYDYDEYGNQTRYTSIDADGTIIIEVVHAFTYENDLLVLDQEFIDGVFYSETTYTVNEEGAPVPMMQTIWNDDGTTAINEYDEHGNCVHSALLEADGTVYFETISEFALVEDGWYTEVRTTSRFADGASFCTESNLMGDPVHTVNIEADGTIWSDTTYEYEYNGYDKVWRKQYSFGRLALESLYDDGVLVTETEYPEEGGSYIYEYNEYGDIILITAYGPDGSLISIESFEYDDAADAAEEWEWNWNFDE